MTSRSCRCAAALLVALTLAPGLAASSAPDDAAIAGALDAYLQRLPAFGVHGGVLVAKEGRVIYARGFGFADRERQLPYTADTVFTVGSITKQFTAAAIMKLVEQGKLDVQDSIAQHFEKVPADKATITLHHLLTHTAGLTDIFGGDHDLHATRDWVVARALEAPLDAAPGERYAYSNVGYSLLGAIVEKVSGRPYEQFLYDELLRPAGMTRTGYRLADWEGLAIAQGYEGDERWGTVLERPWLDDGPCWNLRANGGIHSTLNDMFRWWRALQDDTVLSSASRRQMFTPAADEGGGQSHYGYGWAIMETSRGTKLIAHNGGNGIMFADFRWYEDEDVLILLATGCARAGGQRLSSIVPSIVFGHDVTMPPEISEVSPATLHACAGTYALPSGGTLHVKADGPRLAIAGDGQDAVALLMTGDANAGPEIAAINERSRHIFARAFDGDFQPLFEALGGQMPIEELAAMESQMRRQREEMFGPFVALEVIGSAMPRPGRTVTLLRMRHERGASTLELDWRGERLTGVDVREGPAETAFHPQSPRQFVSFSLDRPVSVTIEFEPGAGGRAAAATVQTPSGPLRVIRRAAGP